MWPSSELEIRMTSHNQIGPEPAWGHSRGLLDIGHQVTLDSGRLADRVAMIDCMYRYAWSFDERQREMLAECFIESATWEASLMGIETIGPFVGRDAVVEFMTGFWADQLDQRRHLIMNAIVDGQSVTEATVMTYHLLVSTTVSEGVVPVTTGFYRAHMVMTPESTWKIHSLLAGYDVPF